MRRSIDDLGGRLDVLVASAGITGPNAAVKDYSASDWRKVFDVNVNGAFYSNRAAVRIMDKSGYGRIGLLALAIAVVWMTTDVLDVATGSLLGQEGAGLSQTLSFVNAYRLGGVGARAVGMASRVLALATDYARQRKQLESPSANSR
jgi:NAD(P)-dependent dehydrogenase (short-subunit alcohol dehydrogenase family)